MILTEGAVAELYLDAMPGTASATRWEEDIAALDVEVSQEKMKRQDRLINLQTGSGPRCPAATLAEIDTEEFFA